MGLEGEELKKAVTQICELVGVKPEYYEKSPFELSGGQKRRAAIAGVIAMNPEVLILDEPTAGLDPKGRDKVLGEIKAYHEEKKNTVLLVSHSMEDIAKYASKVLVMNHGEVEMFDTVENVFSRAERLAEIGLDIPQITRVFLELKKRGYDVNTGVYTLEQAKKELAKYI